jgi:hypothetical protein
MAWSKLSSQAEATTACDWTITRLHIIRRWWSSKRNMDQTVSVSTIIILNSHTVWCWTYANYGDHIHTSNRTSVLLTAWLNNIIWTGFYHWDSKEKEENSFLHTHRTISVLSDAFWLSECASYIQASHEKAIRWNAERDNLIMTY